MNILADLSGDYVEAVPLGGGVQAVRYSDDSWGLRHVCTRPRDGQTLIVAPKFQFDNGHVLTSRSPLTITPSSGCSDCGLHGFVRSGRWEPC